MSPESHLVSEVELTRSQRTLLLRVIGINTLLTILLFLVVGLSAYQGARADVTDKRAGCERSKLDRAANATAWREAQAARTRDGDYSTAAIYKGVADQLERRSRISCAVAFPKPSIIKLAVG